MRIGPLLAAAAVLSSLAAGSAQAQSVGERHLLGVSPTAAYRDAEHSTRLRVTIWYPAAAGAKEERLDLGPPGKPLFIVGAAAPDAAFADTRRRPVILLSHGYGGSARMMGWFGTALARHGYLVVAVDHPGNNGLDPMTRAGAVMHWDRAEDLKAALARVEAEPDLAAHMDPARLGVAGFSAGGFTSLLIAGAREDPARYIAFCTAHPTDGVCMPQKELAVSLAEGQATLAAPENAAEVAHARDDHSLPVKAVFAMAPAIVQALEPDSLAGIRTPVAIVVGAVDPIAAPATNAEVAAHAIPGARLTVLPKVAHYDFLSTCSAAGEATVPLCASQTPRDATHATAIALAIGLFDAALGRP